MMNQFTEKSPHLVRLCFQHGEGKAAVAVQSDTGPRQVRGRWAEQLKPLIIHSNFSPCQVEEEGEEEEEEEDFHPQSLESLLGEDEEEEEEEEEDAEEQGKEVSSLMMVLSPTGSRHLISSDCV